MPFRKVTYISPFSKLVYSNPIRIISRSSGSNTCFRMFPQVCQNQVRTGWKPTNCQPTNCANKDSKKNDHKNKVKPWDEAPRAGMLTRMLQFIMDKDKTCHIFKRIHSRSTRGKPRGNTDLTLWFDTLEDTLAWHFAQHFCGHSCGTLLLDTLIWQSCRTLLRPASAKPPKWNRNSCYKMQLYAGSTVFVVFSSRALCSWTQDPETCVRYISNTGHN